MPAGYAACLDARDIARLAPQRKAIDPFLHARDLACRRRRCQMQLPAASGPGHRFARETGNYPPNPFTPRAGLHSSDGIPLMQLQHCAEPRGPLARLLDVPTYDPIILSRFLSGDLCDVHVLPIRDPTNPPPPAGGLAQYGRRTGAAGPARRTCTRRGAAVFLRRAERADARTGASPDPAPRAEISGPLTEIDYDDFNRIRFRADHVRWADDPSRLFRLNAFHLGWLFKEPVQMYELVDGVSRPMVFSTADFDYRDVKTALPPDLVLPGVAGFRLMAPFNRADLYDEVGSFLGASYFRLLGRGNRYGLSAAVLR